MEGFNESSNTIEEDVLPENYLKSNKNNQAPNKSGKADDLELDLEIEEDNSSNFLLNSEFVKLTKDDIRDVHLDLGLFSETNTKSYLNQRFNDNI